MNAIEEFYLDLVSVLALSPDEQCAYLQSGVPDESSRSAGEFPEGQNLLVDLVRMILDVCPRIDLSGEDEVQSELLELLMLLIGSKESRFWSLSGLKSCSVWRILRNLARSWLKSVGYEGRVPDRSVDDLLK